MATRGFKTTADLAPGWFRPREAAIYSSVSERTVRKWCGRGLRFSKTPTGAILIRREWMDEFLEGFEFCPGETVDGIVDSVMKEIGEGCA